jgi:hypothetical protein
MYKGIPSISGDPLLADNSGKGKKSAKGKGNFYLWRVPSCAPIDSKSTWRKNWNFYAMIRRLTTRNLLRKIRNPAKPVSGAEP